MIAVFFIIIGVLSRLLPHPANVAPIAAISLFGGRYLDKRLGVILPLFAMFLSDIVIGFHSVMPYVYGSFILTSIMGILLRKFQKSEYVIIACISSTLFFFLITNFGVWVQTSLYPNTIDGLLQSYIMALPFLRNSLFGNLFYVTVFFGGYELVQTLRQRNFQFSKRNY